MQKPTYAERLQLHREQLAKERGLDAPEPVQVPTGGSRSANEESPQQLASKLVDAQRKSVDMLTYVKDRVDGLPYEGILAALEKDGYVVVDDFLANDDVVSTLETESKALYESDQMERDISELGAGEYTVTLAGGEDQYPVCPRTIEMVVSVTKNMPSHLKGLDLSSSSCIASMRTFDRKTKMAASALVVDGKLPDRPFDVVIDTDTIDTRRVTLYYYPNGSDWDGDGGITIQENNVRISSKRDRLVLLQSDSCVHRREYFVGKEDRDVAACVELHMVS